MNGKAFDPENAFPEEDIPGVDVGMSFGEREPGDRAAADGAAPRAGGNGVARVVLWVGAVGLLWLLGWVGWRLMHRGGDDEAYLPPGIASPAAAQNVPVRAVEPGPVQSASARREPDGTDAPVETERLDATTVAEINASLGPRPHEGDALSVDAPGAVAPPAPDADVIAAAVQAAVAPLQTQLSQLQEANALLSAQVQALTKARDDVRQKPSHTEAKAMRSESARVLGPAAPKPAPTNVRLMAVLEGRAWLERVDTGETVSVGVGDALPGGGPKVIEIVAAEGEVRLSDGSVLTLR